MQVLLEFPQGKQNLVENKLIQSLNNSYNITGVQFLK